MRKRGFLIDVGAFTLHAECYVLSCTPCSDVRFECSVAVSSAHLAAVSGLLALGSKPCSGASE